MFNTKTTSKNQNHEGATAFSLSAELELYTAVVTSSLSDQFYEKKGERIARIRVLIAKNKPEFVAKLAIYTRKKMYLRAMPLVLAVELAKIHQGDNLVANLACNVIERADEITEILAYYVLANEKQGQKKLNNISKQLQKGIGNAFNKFDEYQFAKYNRDKDIKLRDALFLTHPKAKNETQQAIFNKIAKDELEVPYTWEVELSVLGQTKFETELDKKNAFGAKWSELIQSGKLGYMALLRNLRNILENNVPAQDVKIVCERLANPEEVAKSKQFPFRFLSAYREIEQTQSPFTAKILQTLENAITASVVNIKGFDMNTKVLLACDVSGSMYSPISPKSKVQNFDIGLALAMLLQSKCETVVSGFFGDTWKIVSLPKNQVLSNVMTLRSREGEVGYSTNGYKVLNDLINRKVVMDKVMFFTDCQMWDSTNQNNEFYVSWENYKKIAPNAKLYIFDLVGYGKMPINFQKNDVVLIAGWSDRVFEILEAVENGGNAISEIEKIVLE